VNLHLRLAALEQQLTSESVVLHMADGRSVRFPGDFAVGLLARVCRNERTPEIELVAQSISSIEPGGAHMIDLARAILNSPVDSPV
jgi:hypothetical protein